MTFPGGVWLLPTQRAWATDPWHLRIREKSRQVGATKTDALDSVLKASPADARFDVWVTSRDDIQARLYLEDCMDWAKTLHLAATYLGVLLLDSQNNFSAHVSNSPMAAEFTASLPTQTPSRANAATSK